jgi:hypothetical protein
MNQTMRMVNFIGSKGIDWAEFFGKYFGPFSPLNDLAVILNGLKMVVRIKHYGENGCKLWRKEN